ncbi:MAG TPA: CBS domain-containing protein [Polyangiaceae bacterium]|jgi:CBS domain-containing protein
MLLCSQVMKRRVHSTKPALTVAEAARIMKESLIGFLPICDPAGHPLGVITDRDIVLRAIAADLPGTTQVEEIMSRDPVRCHADTPLVEAEELMLKRKTRRILIVDAADHLTGLITLSDIAQHQQPFEAARWYRELSSMRFRFEK